MEENLSNFMQAQYTSLLGLSNSSMPIILFLYVAYYERVMNKKSCIHISMYW